MNKEFQEGDYVGTRYRGGTREGIVENPNDDGKVVFTDQHGHKVKHNPSTLTIDPKKSARDFTQEERQELQKDWEREMGRGHPHPHPQQQGSQEKQHQIKQHEEGGGEYKGRRGELEGEE